VADSDAKQLRYQSNQEWDQAKELEEMADEALEKRDYDRANDYKKAAEELREDSELKWKKSKV
jgi:hypothetical protein